MDDGRLHDIEARASEIRQIVMRKFVPGTFDEHKYRKPQELELADDVIELATRVRDLEAALRAASDDARILVQDYYSGLPEHRAPVDGAVARLAHLFERDDQDCEARTVDEIITEGMSERAVLAGETAGEPKTWSCTRDHVTEPCGDCDGCRYDKQHAVPPAVSSPGRSER